MNANTNGGGDDAGQQNGGGGQTTNNTETGQQQPASPMVWMANMAAAMAAAPLEVREAMAVVMQASTNAEGTSARAGQQQMGNAAILMPVQQR